MNLSDLAKKLEDFAKNELKATDIEIMFREIEERSTIPFSKADTEKFPHHAGEIYTRKRIGFLIEGVI